MEMLNEQQTERALEIVKMAINDIKNTPDVPKIPNGNFSDAECAFWSSVKRMLRKM